MHFLSNSSFNFKILLTIVVTTIIVLYLWLHSSSEQIIHQQIFIQPKQNLTHYAHIAKTAGQDKRLGIIALLVREDNLTLVGERVAIVDQHFQDNFISPILIFHQGYPLDTEIWELKRQTQRKVILHNVDRYFSEFPPGFDPYVNQPNWWIRQKWNYHHMIHFWFKVVFDLPVVQQYEYIMRLDYDSKVEGIWNNTFVQMKHSRAVYMANFETLDFEWRLRGTLKLKDLVDEFVKEKKLIVQDRKQFERAFTNESARTYWNNFEISQVEFFRQENVTEWVDAVIKSQGIYKYRWGDAILRFVTVSMFAREDQVLHREKLGLGYCHPC